VRNRIKNVVGAVGLAVTLLVMSSPVGAVSTGVDLDTVSVGSVYTPVALTNAILSTVPVFEDHGNLTTQVYANGSVYTYLATLSPKVTGISMFSTSFAVAGLTGSMGWSYTNAIAAGANSVFPGFIDATNIFTASVVGDIVKFTVNPLANAFCPPTCFWTTDDASNPGFKTSITFFYQSTVSPGTSSYATDAYSMTNSFTGSGQGYAANTGTAVPEPTSLLLLFGGVAGVVGLWKGSRRQSA